MLIADDELEEVEMAGREMAGREEEVIEETEAQRASRVRSVVGATVLSGMLEWYDFAVFGYMAAEIGATFFRGGPAFQLLASFGVFGAAFVARPIGGLVFGHVGDKSAAGRGEALEASILVMAIPTLALALLPGWRTIGLAAPILVMLIRVMQGLSVGGQLVGAIVLTAETAPPSQVHFLTALTFSGANSGSLLGAVVSTACHFAFGDAALKRWAWRIPFFLGFALSIFAYSMQRGLRRFNKKPQPEIEMTSRSPMHESEEQDQIQEPKEDDVTSGVSPLRSVLASAEGRRNLVACTLCYGAHCSGFYAVFLFMPTYEVRFLGLDPTRSFGVSVVALMLLIACTPAVGRAADGLTKGKTPAEAQKFRLDAIRVCCVFLLPASPICLYAMQAFSNVFLSLLFLAPLIALQSCLDGLICAWMVQLFHAKNRYSALALAMNLSTALFGGVAPLICSSLASSGGVDTRWYAGLFVSGVAVLSLLGTAIAEGGPSEKGSRRRTDRAPFSWSSLPADEPLRKKDGEDANLAL